MRKKTWGSISKQLTGCVAMVCKTRFTSSQPQKNPAIRRTRSDHHHRPPGLPAIRPQGFLRHGPRHRFWPGEHWPRLWRIGKKHLNKSCAFWNHQNFWIHHTPRWGFLGFLNPQRKIPCRKSRYTSAPGFVLPLQSSWFQTLCLEHLLLPKFGGWSQLKKMHNFGHSSQTLLEIFGKSHLASHVSMISMIFMISWF